MNRPEVVAAVGDGSAIECCCEYDELGNESKFLNSATIDSAVRVLDSLRLSVLVVLVLLVFSLLRLFFALL